MKTTTISGFSQIPPSELRARIDTIPLPKKLKSRFTQRINKWVEHSGIEWTVGRLKSYKDCLLNSYSAGSLQNKPEWFGTTQSGNLDGLFGDLHRYAMQDTANLKAVLYLCNYYTSWTKTELSLTEKEEIKASICRNKPMIPKRSHKTVGISDAFKACKKLQWQRVVRAKTPLPLSWVLPGKESHVARLADDIRTAEPFQLWTDSNEQFVLDAALGARFDPVMLLYSAVAGNIDVTHEPGLKTRYFAAPNLVLQRALEPLKDSLLLFLQKVPWDCTLDQRKADSYIMGRLKHSKQVYSVDLSKATDSFPWEWQYAVGRQVCNGFLAHNMLSLMNQAIENWEWVLPDGKTGKWGAGQPLGLGPSFPLFTLSHGILLYILNGYKWNKQFFVLGDDVVIFNEDLHTKYREVLGSWGVGISEAKSFTSNRLAQFAGVTFTQEESFWQPKWRPLTRQSLLDAAAWWFPGLTKGYKEHDLIERILALPEPYGKGRNPKGIPLDERFSAHVVEKLLEYKQRRDAKIKIRATRPDFMNASRIWRKCQIEEQEIYSLTSRWSSDSVVSPDEICRCHGATSSSTEGALIRNLGDLVHRTEIGGMPHIRLSRRRVDSYSLGSLKMWKHILGPQSTQTSE